jgi:uncharacterized protein with HEPN domain
MLQAVERLESYIEGVEWKAFAENEVLQEAIMRQLEILGEAAGRISRERAHQFKEIPWSQVTGLRHKLIHHYFVVDLEVVWASATEDVPQLKPHLIEMIRELQW